MAVILTIPQCIQVGEITVPLCLTSTAENVLWGSRVIQTPDPVEIALFTDILLWQYEQFPNDSTLRGTANYLIWLCGIFAQRATGFSGGGSVIPIPGRLMPNKIEFNVDGSTPIPTGGTTLTLPLTWAGLGVIFSRGGQPQSSINTEPSYFSWNPVTRIFACFPAAAATELFSINPV